MAQRSRPLHSHSQQSGAADKPNILRAALADLADSGTLSRREITDIVERALVAAYRQQVSDDTEIRAHLGDDGSYTMHSTHQGVDETLLQLNDSVIRQAVRFIRMGLEEQKLMKESHLISGAIIEKKGFMIDAILEGSEDDTWLLKGDDFLALLPPQEQIPGEMLQSHTHTKVVVLGARKYAGSIVAIVSRTHPMLVRRILEQEIPEISHGQIVIDAVSREAGRRSKVAVHALDTAIDAQGACIGPKGVRHRSVVNLLGGEHVHIVTWSADTATYIANALAPATVRKVRLDEDEHVATVLVPSGQLSLAIGKGGENARLVAKLTSWKIDIRPEDTDLVEDASAEVPQE